MRYFIAAAVSIAAIIGTGVAVHDHDAHELNQQIVINYNAGFLDGVCTGSVTIALRDYHYPCQQETGK